MKNFIFLTVFLVLVVATTFSQRNNLHFDNKPYVEGEFLVQLTSENELAGLLKKAPETFELKEQKYLSAPMRVWLLSFNHHAVSHEQLQYWLYQQKEVSLADYNYYIEMRSTIPGDASFTQQWHHRNTGQTGGTPGADISSHLAWDITTGGRTATNDDIVICLIESGNLDHQDLSPNRWRNLAEIPGNGIDDDGNGYVDDYNGWNPIQGNDNYGNGAHGTNCLGMMGAKGDNGFNVVGANWDVKLMVVGDYSINTQAEAIQAYTYPLVMRKRWNETGGTQGAFVVATSSSWGIDGANPANYPIWCAFYDTLGTHGILNIGATTNSNLNVDTAGDMPTACPSNYMIGVGRTDHNDNTAGGYGVNTVYLGAPGINVVTTSGSTGITTTTGTSFSCPLTAGVVGLAYSIPCPSFMSIVKSNPKLGADLVRDALLNGVDVKSQLSSRFKTGGRLNAKNTLDLLMDETCSTCFAENIQAMPADNAATISFSVNNEVTSTKLYWRKYGTTDWQIVPQPTSPYQLVGLENCTVYEYYLETTCSTEVTSSAMYTIATTNCGNCIDLSYCSTKATGSNQGRLAVMTPTLTVTDYIKTDNWGGAVDQNYVYEEMVLMQGSSAIVNEGCGTLSNAGNLSGKIAVALRGTCNFSEKALLAQNAGALALVIINNQTAAPASLGSGTGAGSVTIPVIMISQAQGSSLLQALQSGESTAAILGKQKEWIASFQLGQVTYQTGDNNGYLAPTSTDGFDVELGSTYAFKLTPGFSAQTLPERVRIWFDENQDGQFSSNELLYDQTVAGFGEVMGTLTIPSTAATGVSRMRIQMAYVGTGQATLPSTCSDFTWGEVEDYCVTIGNNMSVTSLKTALFNIYPNPASNHVTIQATNHSAQWQVQIVDVVGKVWSVQQFQNNTVQLSIDQLQSGTYFFQVKDENGELLHVEKIIIQK
jgi:hypothetical protein